MESEETPLLHSNHDDVYNRFSAAQKRAILCMVSATGLLPMLVAGTFTPSLLQISKDLNTTVAVVNVAISFSAFALSIGGLAGSVYSTFYGRRPTYVYALPLFILASIGVATAPNTPTLFISRFCQSLGASPGQVIGAGVIGDVYRVEERGRAMGIFFAAILLGPMIAPLVGGTVTYYFSWRAMQGSLGAVGLLVWIVMLVYFPETSQPGARGVDKLRIKEGENWRQRFVFVNPLRPLALLRSPNLFFIAVISFASSLAAFVHLVPIVFTIGVRYNIKNEAILGLCFLPSGLGCMAGAQIIGRVSDYTVIKWRKKRNGVWYPEDRLRAALIPYGVITPLATLAFGFVNQYVSGNLGLFLCLVNLFVSGAGIEMCFGPCAAYLVDVMHSRSAESIGAINGFRIFLIAFGISGIVPMMNAYGIALTNAVSAAILWVAFGMLLCVIRYGEQMRAWVDIGFSTPDDN